ncbi:uridine kinase [Marinomonas sp. 15G1-11]|uniref:Uridine kinase n=1 Tax=Marinomonas phaeophyticola TaxID=3004091 RepID=A0ABT4JV97_9GAMM|nr:uridine kinase [Marinomonas sp. 15G1-11]MCZ2722160.1 uridine kinase [Marinomonas sp. 15G1-11]
MKAFLSKCQYLKIIFITLTLNFLQSEVALAEVEDLPELKVYSQHAELFGLKINDLSQADFEKQLDAMGLRSYPSFRKGIASYSLGEEGILGVRALTVIYNKSKFVEKISLAGVVKDNEKRKALGNLLINKYGIPTVGFVNQGFGRAQWLFADGTLIELHNTTFDVSVAYVDRSPKIHSLSGQIDVESLQRKNRISR